MSRRLKTWLLVGVLVTMINLPLAGSLLQQRDLGANGTRVDVPAQPVTVSPEAGSDVVDRLVGVSLPDAVVEAVVGEQREQDAPEAQDERVVVSLERPAYDAVVESGRAEVVYLPDNPKVYRVTGRDSGNAALLTTLVADGVLVVLVGLFLLLRHRLRPELRLLATGDLETSSDTDGLLERIEGQTYRVRGAVAAIEDDEVVLEVGDRRVRVHLDGHHNPAGHQEGVEVRGTMVG
ncbi:hypothetical protein ABKW28_08510 [Nocardioides sp. 31GB23]|uniref:hypothetical protein n=1 Tax=Nocardioides sp. 31GB23 TaxID=3156065 RepID=UPI0032AEF929